MKQIVHRKSSGDIVEPPKPIPCFYCGKDNPYIMVSPDNDLYMWRPPDPCDCEESQKRVQQYKQEQEDAKRREEAKRIESLFRESKMPGRFQHRTFDNFEPHNKETQNALEISQEYVRNFPTPIKKGQGLYFGGTVGTGKTHLAAAISIQLLNQGHSVIFGTASSLFQSIRDTYDDESKLSERRVMDSMMRCDLLVLDDLGKENPTPWLEEKLFEVINYRYENERSIIITTNIHMSEVERRYKSVGKALVSRIYEMCDGINIPGDDYRKMKG